MSESSPVRQCPTCGAVIPHNALQGLCPKCLLLGVAAPTEACSTIPNRLPPPPLEAVATAFPHLEIVALIGQGGMGCVFKARQPQLNRFVALKILPEALGRDAAFSARFTREAQSLAALSHPNIVTIHDFGFAPTVSQIPDTSQTPEAKPQTQGFYYLLMEFVNGVNLRQALGAGRFTPEQALSVVPKICDALQFAHERGIIHRDIKPENILLDREGRVKIADFGIAKMLAEEGGPLTPSLSPTGGEGARRAGEGELGLSTPIDSNLTGNSAAGTPGYMAPEQRATPQSVDRRADIYSLGVVFYEMLTGELPGERLQPPSRKVQIDVRLDEIVLRALEKTPELRYQTAAELKTQVETLVQPSTAPPPVAQSPHPNWQLAAALSVTVFYASQLIGVLFVNMLPVDRDFGYLLLLAVALVASPLLGFPTASSLRRRKASGSAESAASARGWLKACAWLSFIVALPAIGFGLFFLQAMMSETGGWHPALSEAVFVPLTWLGALLLPLATLVLLREVWSSTRPGSVVRPGQPRHAGWTQPTVKSLALASLIALLMRVFFLQPFVVMTDAAAPELPRGSRVLVWKLARQFLPGDLIAYTVSNHRNLGRVVGNAEDAVVVHRNGEGDLTIRRSAIVGKVFSVYWRSSGRGTAGQPPSQNSGARSPILGPDTEIVLRDTLSSGEMLALDRKVKPRLPADAKQRARTWFVRWLANEGVDLAVIDYGEDMWGLVARQTLSRINGLSWLNLDVQMLDQSLDAPKPGLERIDASDTRLALYRLWAGSVPQTFAFRTAGGRLAAVEITGFTDNPRGVKIRYKLAQGTAARPVTPAAAPNLPFSPMTERGIAESTATGASLKLIGTSAHYNVALARIVSHAGLMPHYVVARCLGPAIPQDRWSVPGGLSGVKLVPPLGADPEESVSYAERTEFSDRPVTPPVQYASEIQYICPGDYSLAFVMPDRDAALKAVEQIEGVFAKPPLLTPENPVRLFAVGEHEGWMEMRPYQATNTGLVFSAHRGMSPIPIPGTNWVESYLAELPPGHDLKVAGEFVSNSVHRAELGFATTLPGSPGGAALYWFTWYALPNPQVEDDRSKENWELCIHDAATGEELDRFQAPESIHAVWTRRHYYPVGDVRPGKTLAVTFFQGDGTAASPGQKSPWWAVNLRLTILPHTQKATSK